jgi:hypothetical protein
VREEGRGAGGEKIIAKMKRCCLHSRSGREIEWTEKRVGRERGSREGVYWKKRLGMGKKGQRRRNEPTVRISERKQESTVSYAYTSSALVFGQKEKSRNVHLEKSAPKR